MTLTARLFASRLLGLALVGFAATSCTITQKGDGADIDKVKSYNLQPLQVIRTQDPTIRFEREHYLYGAYTAAEQIARTGQYYTVLWAAHDRSQPLTVKFEFRQEKTALQVKSIEQQIAEPKKHNVTEFRVIGPDYVTGGRVTAWRVSILRGKQEIVSQDSFLWK